jgi:GNAT superfamily N-acetyltransferase
MAENTSPAQAWIDQVYSQYQDWPYGQADRVMVWGAGEDQQFAAFKLKPGADANTVEIDWLMAGPEQRKGIGSRAIKELQRQAQPAGIKLTLYPWAKGKISQKSLTKLYQRHGFNPTTKGAKAMTWQPINEINDEDELSVSQQVEEYFTNRGYRYLGSGRDQIAFRSPRGTVVKVVGIGEEEREDIVKTYVGFFLRNQRNTHYPRIYNAGDFTVDDETYFVYEMEYLNPVSGEGPILEYLEDLMHTLERNGDRGVAAFRQNRPLPSGLSEQQIDGLLVATQDLQDAIGGPAPLDLGSIENLGRRKDGQIVIIDPFSL